MSLPARVALPCLVLVTACRPSNDPPAEDDTLGVPESSSSAESTTTTGVAESSSEGESTDATSSSSETSSTSSSTGEPAADDGFRFDLPPLPDVPVPTLIETDIAVVFTADNAYSFGYGTDDGLEEFFGGVEAITAGQIFNCGEGPELYLVPAEHAAFATWLYVIAYADSSVTQGVLGQFQRIDDESEGALVHTGDPGWEVCATGVDYQPGSGGPDLATINAFIEDCNDGALDPATTSVGWVDHVGTQYGAVAVGEDNTTPYNGGPQAGNEFPLVCPADMAPEARWMWFNWDPQHIVWPAQSPFLWPGGVNPDHQFLIFRFPSSDIPIPIAN